MFSYFINRFLSKKKSETPTKHQGKVTQKLSPSLEKNLRSIQEILGEPPDLLIKNIKIEESPVSIVCFSTMVKKEMINSLVHNLVVEGSVLIEDYTRGSILDLTKNRILSFAESKEVADQQTLLEELNSGKTLILFDTETVALALDTRSWETRGIEDSKNESLLRGPRDAFVESLDTNIALIRRRLNDTNLRLLFEQKGVRSKTKIALVFIKDVVDPEVLEELKARLAEVKIDAILESGMLEQLIEDNPYSPFPQVQFSERPDKAVAHMLEGKIVILVDSTPFCLIVPAVFTQFLNSPEDYYERWIMASFIRLTRYAATFISMFLPAFYIAGTSFHYELIPSDLIFPMAEARGEVPFSPLVEALFMELTIELLREAGIRLPGAIGQTIGVVGGIIIGNAAIQAGLVGPVMVIVVAITAISTFIIPNYNMGLAVRFVRFPMMILAGFFGLYGMIIGWLLLTIHLVSLESFGKPYFSPFTPLKLSDLKDTILRFPLFSFINRPRTWGAKDSKRQVPKGNEE